MKLKRKFFVEIALVFIILGILIGGLGFALSGFSPQAYDDNGNAPWYQTFHVFSE